LYHRHEPPVPIWISYLYIISFLKCRHT
jgi:hypothetical protein